MTVIVTSWLRVLHPFEAVSLYVRVEEGATGNAPLSAPRDVTAPVARSVIERDVVLETLKLRLVVCPALTVEAEALKPLMTARGVTVIETSCVTLPAPFEAVRR